MLKCISKQNLIKIYHAVKSYEHCYYLTTTGWTDAQRSLVHEAVLQTILDVSSSRTVRIEANFQEVWFWNTRSKCQAITQKGQKLSFVMNRDVIKWTKKNIPYFLLRGWAYEFQNRTPLSSVPGPLFTHTVWLFYVNDEEKKVGNQFSEVGTLTEIVSQEAFAF